MVTTAATPKLPTDGMTNDQVVVKLKSLRLKAAKPVADAMIAYIENKTAMPADFAILATDIAVLGELIKIYQDMPA